jgi:ribosomal protein S4
MNKHFFKKKSTLSFIEKLRRRNYTIKSRKNISFLYIFERRLLVVIGRLYLTRIAAAANLRFLIENGYISVDNELIRNPYYLTPHRAIIRVIKTLPLRMSKVPKRLIMNNLR